MKELKKINQAFIGKLDGCAVKDLVSYVFYGVCNQHGLPI